jgi:hypothetical protein
LRKVLAPLSPRRLRPAVEPGQPPPWLDCDTPADLARARALAGESPRPQRPAPSVLPRFQEPTDPR